MSDQWNILVNNSWWLIKLTDFCWFLMLFWVLKALLLLNQDDILNILQKCLKYNCQYINKLKNSRETSNERQFEGLKGIKCNTITGNIVNWFPYIQKNNWKYKNANLFHWISVYELSNNMLNVGYLEFLQLSGFFLCWEFIFFRENWHHELYSNEISSHIHSYGNVNKIFRTSQI